MISRGNTSTRFQPRPITRPTPPRDGPHILRVTDAADQPVPGARIRIDDSITREANGAGVCELPRGLLPPGRHRLAISSDAHVTLRQTVVVRSAALDLTVQLLRPGQRAQPAAGGDAVEPTPIALAWGADPFAVSSWQEIDPTAYVDPLALTSDQPIEAKTDLALSTSDYGAFSAILTGVPAGEAVTWAVSAAPEGAGPKILFQATGPCMVVWVTYDGTPHAEAVYTITATHLAVDYVVTLTIG